MIRLGCFGTAAQLFEIERAGFDTIELDLCEIVKMPETEFAEFLRSAQESRLTFDVCSGLFPLSLRFYEQDFSESLWLEHVEKGAERAAQLQCRMIPLGAGKCRSMPRDRSKWNDCQKKLLEFVEKICGILDRYGILLAVEPLGPANSNYLNYIGETAEFVRKVPVQNCRTMCDLRHMVKNQEDFGEILKYRNVICHAHIDYPLGDRRRFPQIGDGYDYSGYLDMLKVAGYDGVLTIEATSWQDFSVEAASSAEFLKQEIHKRAGV